MLRNELLPGVLILTNRFPHREVSFLFVCFLASTRKGPWDFKEDNSMEFLFFPNMFFQRLVSITVQIPECAKTRVAAFFYHISLETRTNSTSRCEQKRNNLPFQGTMFCIQQFNYCACNQPALVKKTTTTSKLFFYLVNSILNDLL